jgi:hemoglobin
MDTAPTLYDWAGGTPAFRRLIDAFYDRVESDDLLSPLFPGGVGETHRDHVVAWWCEVFGGPARYTDEIGGYEHMLGKHRGLDITPEQRFRFASLMSLAADDAQLPDDPEFRSAFVAYVEWGTRLALHNSQAAAEVVEHTPVPRWGWGRSAAVPAVTVRFYRRAPGGVAAAWFSGAECWVHILPRCSSPSAPA